MARKNKGTFGKGKSDIPETDEFISGAERFFERLRPHAIGLAVLSAVVGIVLIAAFGYRSWQNEKATDATGAYVQTAEILAEPLASDFGAKDAENAHETAKIRGDKALTAIQQLDAGYGGTQVAEHAILLRAALLFQVGKYDEAVKAYQQYNAPPNLRAFAKQGLGYALETVALNKKEPADRDAGLQLALNAFRDMQPDPEGGLSDHSLYHQARILTLLSKNQEAIEMFQKVAEREPRSILAEQAERRLVALGTSQPNKEKSPKTDKGPTSDQMITNGKKTPAKDQKTPAKDAE